VFTLTGPKHKTYQFSSDNITTSSPTIVISQTIAANSYVYLLIFIAALVKFLERLTLQLFDTPTHVKVKIMLEAKICWSETYTVLTNLFSDVDHNEGIVNFKLSTSEVNVRFYATTLQVLRSVLSQ